MREGQRQTGWGVASYSWPWTLLIYLLTAPFAEVFFYLHSQRYLRLSSERSHRTFVADTDSAEAERALFRLFGELSGPELQQMLRGWFLGSGEMQRENMRELFAWIVCNSRVDELKPTRVARIDALVEHVEEAIGKAFPPGRNEGLRAMTYTLEALEPTAHKPLAFYLALQSAHKLFGAGLSCMGFRLRREGALRYWHRPAITCFRRPLPPTPPPLVLMHGVGGLLPYALLIAQLTRTWRGAILIPAFPSCAMACMPRTVFADETLPPTELSAALVAMVRRHAPQRAPEGSDGTDGTDGSDGSDGSVPPPRAAFLAHSLGSAHLAALLKASPDVAAAVAFIDPICFQLMYRHVLFNFLYASPSLNLDNFFHWAQRKLATEEPTIQNCFRRGFWWSHYWLHPTDLPCDAFVLLSGRDTVADPYAVLDYLTAWQKPLLHTGLRLQVKLFEGWPHGWLMAQVQPQRRLILNLQRAAVAAVSPTDGRAASTCLSLGTSPLKCAGVDEYGVGTNFAAHWFCPTQTDTRSGPTPPHVAYSRARGARTRVDLEGDEGDTASVTDGGSELSAAQTTRVSWAPHSPGVSRRDSLESRE